MYILSKIVYLNVQNIINSLKCNLNLQRKKIVYIEYMKECTNTENCVHLMYEIVHIP